MIKDPGLIKEKHEKAMDLCEEAFFLKRKSGGHTQQTHNLLKSAYTLESEAAMMLKEESDCEPTRSIMFQSAAELAQEIGLYKEQVELATEGLRFCIYAELKIELEKLTK